MLTSRFRFLFVLALAISWSVDVRATVMVERQLSELSSAAANVFRGRCISAEVDTVEIAGAHIPFTIYTFQVQEHLKGKGGATLVFHQAGRPEGGPLDLGALVGLPVYSPGTEYVLFLLPESSAGLTSPAGAGDGAFAIVGDQLRPLRGRTSWPTTSGATRGAASFSYESVRRAVRQVIVP